MENKTNSAEEQLEAALKSFSVEELESRENFYTIIIWHIPF